MEQQYVSPIDGVEVERGDFDLVSKNAALAVDRALAELLRLGTFVRGVIPAGTISGSGNTAGGILHPSGASDARTQILPFRAVIGADEFAQPTTLDQIQGNRSAILDALATPVYIQHAAASNNRWDLIYARVDANVADAAVTRYVKDTSDAVSAQSVSVTQSTKVTIGVVTGVEGTTPAQPAVPADSGSSFYIAIGFVVLYAGHTLTTAIANSQIAEIPRTLSVAPATGCANIRPASYASLIANWAASSTGRPKGFMPSSAVGGETRVLPLHLGTQPDSSIPLGDSIVDMSVDWRNRFFKVTATIDALNTHDLPWVSYVPVSVDPMPVAKTPYVFVGQSYVAGSTHLILSMSSSNTSTPAFPGGASLTLWVDASNGYLMASLTGTPGMAVLLWIEATGYHPNARDT